MNMTGAHAVAMASFMPHGYCYNWIFSLVSLHVISDGLIAISYYMIPFTLAYFISQRKDIPFDWIFLCFCIFIVACGTTHIMEIWTLWHANYWVSGVIKALTALVSLTTAILLIRLIPAALALPSPSMYAAANRSLEKQIHESTRKEAELQLALNTIRVDQIKIEEQNRQLEAANRLKSEFLANMSHELRTPLNGIIGFTEIMRDGLTGPITAEQREYLGDVLTGSKHLLRLINEILDLSTIEAGKLKLQPEHINVTKLVNEIITNFSPEITKKKMQVDVNIDSRLSDIFVDPARLKQIFYNYISNALKFTPDKGKISVRIFPENEKYFRLEVQDTGIGIKEEHLDSLFTVFHQLDAGMTKKYPGTGLGLALVRGLVQAQGGREGVVSVFGEGSTFYAILPYQSIF